ncbi:transcription factor IIIA [Monosporozyma unispora]|nr:hypothetical protein C6P44_001096 [Kazachstania unispora]
MTETKNSLPMDINSKDINSIKTRLRNTPDLIELSNSTPPQQWTSDDKSQFSDVESVTSSTSSSRAKRYFCDYDGCNKGFTRPSLLTQHQQTSHQGIRPFTCDQCNKTFTRKSHLERHLISHMNDKDKPFHCPVCNKGCTTSQQLKRHEITHTKSFHCPYEGCSETFYKHPQLRSHILSFHLNKLNCEICDKHFQRPYRLRQHMAKYHNPNNLNPYACNFSTCSQSFKTWTMLQNHIKNDHPKLSCPVCHKYLVGEDGLKMHMKIHDDSIIMKKNWNCSICQLEFNKKMDLIQHYKSDHPEVPFTFEQDPNELSNNNNNNNNNNNTHQPRHMDGPDINSEPNNIQNQVNIETYLNETYNSGIKLLLNTVGRKFKCTFQGCHRTFKTQEKFEVHLNKHKIHQLKLRVLEEKEARLKDSKETETP